MKFRDRLRLIFNATFGRGSEDFWREVGWLPGSGGRSLNADTVLGIAGVWKAVNVIGKDIATLPLHKYQRLQPQGKNRVRDASTRLLNSQANVYTKSVDHRLAVQMQALLQGNGYAEIQRDPAGAALALWWLPTENVTLEVDASGFLWYVLRQPQKEPRRIRPENILHIKGPAKDALTGWSLVTLARESFALTSGQETYARKQYENGVRPSMILRNAGNGGTAEQRKEFRETVERAHQGADKAFRMMMLYGGWEASPWSMTNDDAQWLEGRQFQVEEIARWFDLPPHKLGAMGRATWNNVESMQLEYVAGCLQFWLTQWQQECDAKLLPEREKLADTHFYEFKLDALLKGDTLSRYQVYAIGRSIGVLSPNEIREKENMNPREDEEGDSYDNPNTASPKDDGPNAPGDKTDRRETQDDGNKSPRSTPFDPKKMIRMGELAATESHLVRMAAENSPNFVEYVERLYDPEGSFYSYVVDVFEFCESEGAAEWCRVSHERLMTLTETVTLKELPKAVATLLTEWPMRASDFCLGVSNGG